MKLLIKLFLFALVPISVLAQDSAVVITSTMYVKSGKNLTLSNIDGWVFRQGNDTNWAKEQVNTSGWKKLKPTQLTEKYADKTGRVEGWFRIKLKIDSGFTNDTLALQGSSWAAADFYLNGKLIFSQGNTGINGKPYHEFDGYIPPVPVDFKHGGTYILAVHFLDYVSPYPPHKLKSSFGGIQSLISITSRVNDISFNLTKVKKSVSYNIIWITTIAVLSILFWLIYFLNRNEKNILFIAILSTIYGLFRFCIYIQESSMTITFSEIWWYRLLINLLIPSISILTILILANAFKRHITKGLIIYLIITSLCMIVSSFTTPGIEIILVILLVSGILVVILYYIFSSWSTLNGAQWAIVIGLLSTFILGIAYLVIENYGTPSSSFYYFFSTFWVLTLPFSFLIYVSLRFKEILEEVRGNAERVIQLSEEKKEQAIQQQQVLQKEVDRQTHDLRKTLEELKSTQSQLIQSEKMASLGELTAGIAHEIQNPLNFVNNFSEVSNELIEELKIKNYELKIEDPEVKELLNDIGQNLEKINHHGQRAADIVKGMLQHSRSSTGQKELTDINALCDEYLRLAYHGMRAKDKSFNSEMKTDFDESIGKINIVPQDIGRVILNLINNAFYAVNEKKKLSANGYQPTAKITTRRINDKVEIIVADNGNGIPSTIKDKIFQPFFTTKPTGQGTGLGLSLSYDIVKAHGGEIKVISKENEGTEFIILLPCS